MNLQLMKEAAIRSAWKGNLILRKNSPQILLGAGIVGGVVAAILAAKATLKAGPIVEDMKYDIFALDQATKALTEEALEEGIDHDFAADSNKERAMIYAQAGLKFAKLYGPSVGLGVLSIASILGAHNIMTSRQVSLIAAYNVLQEGINTYRSRVAEAYGEETERDLYFGVKDEKYTIKGVDKDGNKTKEKKTRKVLIKDPGSVYSRFFDATSRQYQGNRKQDRAFLLRQQNYANDLLTIRGYVFLNEVYESIGIPHSPEGQLVGWVLKSAQKMKEEQRDGYVSFGLEDEDNNATVEFMDGMNESVLLNFNVDGIVYDLIREGKVVDAINEGNLFDPIDANPDDYVYTS